MKNAINWFEIPIQDYERGKSFYENILSIKMEVLEIPNGPKMALFPVDEKSDYVGGALVHYPAFYKTGTEGPLVYLNANPDCQSALDKVEKLGGKILIPKRMITEERGFMSVVEDSEGNRIALHSDS